jgi:hypothetical protein
MNQIPYAANRPKQDPENELPEMGEEPLIPWPITHCILTCALLEHYADLAAAKAWGST